MALVTQLLLFSFSTVIGASIFLFFFQKENVESDPKAGFSAGGTGSITLKFLLLSSTIG